MAPHDDLPSVYPIFLKEHYAVRNDDIREEGNLAED